MPPETKTLPKGKKRQFLASPYASARETLSLGEIRNLAKNDPKGFVEKVNEAIDNGSLAAKDITDWKGLFAALEGIRTPTIMEVPGFGKRTIATDAFPMLTGGLTVAAINAAYQEVPTIGQDLVTEMDSNKKIQVVANIHPLGHSQERVKETEDFPLVGSVEEWFTIESRRNGLRSEISQELIEENDTAGIMERITAPGEIASEIIEEQTLRRVTDADGSNTSSSAEPKVFRPSGVGTQLYTTTADNLNKR